MFIAVMNGYRERRAGIEQLGKELLEVNEQGLEQVEGHRVVELLATTPIASADDSSSPDSNGSASHSASSVRLYPACSVLGLRALGAINGVPQMPLMWYKAVAFQA